MFALFHISMAYLMSMPSLIAQYLVDTHTGNISTTLKCMYALAVVLMTRWACLKVRRWYYQLPPGPDSLIPIIGAQLSTLWNVNCYHRKLPKKYGDILYHVNEFGKPAILVSESTIAKKLLSGKDTTDRGFPPSFYQDRGFAVDGAHLAMQDGDAWKKTRKLIHKGIHCMDTKFVNACIRDSIKTEFEPLMDECSASKTPFLFRDPLTHLTFDVIFRSNFGRNVTFDDDQIFKTLCQDLADTMNFDYGKRVMIENILPEFLIPKWFLEPMWKIKQRIGDNIIKIIDHHKNDRNNRQKNDEMTFMDHLDQQVKEEGIEYSDKRRIIDVFLLFIAGTDTTATTLEWGLIALAKQPDVQERVRKELMSVMEKNGVNYTDTNDTAKAAYDLNMLLQLPLFRACIHEVLRISSVARVGFPHCVTSKEDKWITTKAGKKYRVPTGSALHYNIEMINTNISEKEQWKNKQYGLHEQSVCLENWLVQEQGQTKFVMNPSFMTFGHGKRDCVGKALAMRELRVVLGFVLLHYKLNVEDKFNKSPAIDTLGVTTVSLAKPIQIPILVEKIH